VRIVSLKQMPLHEKAAEPLQVMLRAWRAARGCLTAARAQAAQRALGDAS
jgi:hypothetical protein